MKKSLKISSAAVMIAMSFVLSWVSKIIPSPWLQGGSITIASAVPVMAAGIVLGTKTGIISGVIFSLFQLITGFYPPPVQSILNFILVVIFDYILAFGVYGMTGFFCRAFGRCKFAVPLSGAICMIFRYLCHIVSGVLIWGTYSESGALIYSVFYNGGYMIPEIIITVTALGVMTPVIIRIEKRYNK